MSPLLVRPSTYHRRRASRRSPEPLNYGKYVLYVPRGKAGERDLARFDENRRAQNLKVGMPNPMRDKNEGTYRGGRREYTCDHGLSRRSRRVEHLTRVELETKSVDYKNEKKTKKRSYSVPCTTWSPVNG